MSGDFPHAPGWRSQAVGETSREAAIAQRARAPKMMERVLDLLEQGPASPEQLHAKLTEDGEYVLLTSVRARVCQLHKLGRVVDSGARGLGESRRARVIIWRLATPAEFAAFQAAKEAADE